MIKEKPSLEEVIEVGLNILAQDIAFPSHTEKDIDNYINRFKLIEVEND